ncbi:hypothetical protein GGE68_001405 [Rhizobium leguminosarum]|uniref:hypothetical protein n=1 Tax=Rhizobium leguminosarum TaxID=384 RepID=UPI001616D16A|nr:hypothetical protein [Rhizobium leguminosarum]MBB5663229.1 hypothetical protein [Rhizobium leguminosarum]
MTGLKKNPPQWLLDRYACTKDEWLMLRDLGLQMIADGTCKSDTTPLRAYQHQQQSATVRRGIPFKLTLMEWWNIWDESGRWADRGMGRGWHMCRVGDLGAYEVGNVFIGEGTGNLSAAAKVQDLPIGVALSIKRSVRRFRAYCNVGGKQRHIGVFDTVEEAERAYLKALALDNEIRALADERFEILKADVQGKSRSVIKANVINALKARDARLGAAAWTPSSPITTTTGKAQTP